VSDITECGWNRIEKKSTKTNSDVSSLLPHLNLNTDTNIHIYILADTDMDNSDSISIFPSLQMTIMVRDEIGTEKTLIIFISYFFRNGSEIGETRSGKRNRINEKSKNETTQAKTCRCRLGMDI
jgi:hypothetical protein